MKKKLKININRAPLSSEEIATKRNFEHVLNQFNMLTKPFYQTTYFRGITFLVVTATIATMVFFMLTKKSKIDYNQKILLTDSIPSQEYIINQHRDTVLTTLKGAKVSIPAEALHSSNDGPVVLVIKEAYSIEDIVLAGLTTKSGNELLSSGGMIYIQAKDSLNVHIQKSISVSIPTDEINYSMNVYNGNLTDKGTLDWQNPKPLKNLSDKEITKGEELFRGYCQACHTIGKDTTGPDLAHMSRRRDMDWLIHFTKTGGFRIFFDTIYYEEGSNDTNSYHINSYKIDPYSMCIYEKFGRKDMTLFPFLSDNEIKSIYDYINMESDRKKVPYPDDQLYVCSKKCEKYNELISKLNSQKVLLKNKRSDRIVDNGKFIKEISELTSVLQIPASTPILLPQKRKSLITKMNKSAEYYEIEINSFGWYNIDILTKNLPGMRPSSLIVKVEELYKDKFSLFLVLPSQKINASGGLLKDRNDEYGFYEDNGNIVLPEKTTAYIYMVGEQDQKLLYASAVFQTSLNNRIELKPEIITKEEFNKRIKELLKNDEISIQAKDSKNSNEIKTIDNDLQKLNIEIQEAEKLKPTECDCNCGVIQVK